MDRNHMGSSRVRINWVPFFDSRQVPVLFNQNAELLEAFSTYLFYLAREKIKCDGLSPTKEGAYCAYIRKAAYGISSFASFLEMKRLDWRAGADEILEAFREDGQARSLRSKSGRTELTTKRTTNEKLREVYRFYLWAQEDQWLIANQMGWPDAKITSFLPTIRSDPARLYKNKHLEKLLYPLCYKRVGEGSRNKNTHYATDQELESIRSLFYKNCTSTNAERNVLIVDIIESVGWRQGSIHSLKTCQFDIEKIGEALRMGHTTYPVVPEVQKGGRLNKYEIPLPLACRIASFILKNRSELLDRKHKSEAVADGYIFISYTTCASLGKYEISRIVSRAFKAIGAPKGAGPHSIRRKFGKEKATEILQIRQRIGASMSPEDAVQDVMHYLGHSHAAAQEAYTRGKLDVYQVSIESDLRMKNELLKARVAKLESKLSMMGRGSR